MDLFFSIQKTHLIILFANATPAYAPFHFSCSFSAYAVDICFFSISKHLALFSLFANTTLLSYVLNMRFQYAHGNLKMCDSFDLFRWKSFLFLLNCFVGNFFSVIRLQYLNIDLEIGWVSEFILCWSESMTLVSGKSTSTAATECVFLCLCTLASAKIIVFMTKSECIYALINLDIGKLVGIGCALRLAYIVFDGAAWVDVYLALTYFQALQSIRR